MKPSHEIAALLIDAYARGDALPPLTESNDDFDLDAAYDVLAAIAQARSDAGWEAVGRKIGFTNRTIWELYNVRAPMWAHVWDRTLVMADDNAATVPLGELREPRLEPEVVFKLRGPVPDTDDPGVVLAQVEWIAPGFEIVHSPYPGWRFALPDACAAFGLHGRLVVGTPVAVDDTNRAELATRLATFEATLFRDGAEVERGVGANVLDSPALALAFLARVVAGQPGQAPLRGGEIVTTGTITNAFPVVAGETWSSDYGNLGLDGLTITFT